jgi:hypothetical protein
MKQASIFGSDRGEQIIGNGGAHCQVGIGEVVRTKGNVIASVRDTRPINRNACCRSHRSLPGASEAEINVGADEIRPKAPCGRKIFDGSHNERRRRILNGCQGKTRCVFCRKQSGDVGLIQCIVNRLGSQPTISRVRDCDGKRLGRSRRAAIGSHRPWRLARGHADGGRHINQLECDVDGSWDERVPRERSINTDEGSIISRA